MSDTFTLGVPAEPSSSCGTTCGWIAGVLGIFAVGTLNVPLKSEVGRRLNIDPLVFLTYVIAWNLLYCWLVVFLGQEIAVELVPGIASALLLLPGVLASFFAVKAAGLAVSSGTYSSLKVVVASLWGYFVFEEEVLSVCLAVFAASLIILGISGMSYFSAPSATTSNNSTSNKNASFVGMMKEGSPLLLSQEDLEIGDEESSCATSTESSTAGEAAAAYAPPSKPTTTPSSPPPPVSYRTMELVSNHRQSSMTSMSSSSRQVLEHVVICGKKVSRRRVGFLCAVFDGIWGGSVMVPMHYSKYRTNGLGFVISLAVGNTIVLLLLWILRLLYHTFSSKCLRTAVHALPSMHIQTFWQMGAISGALWSIASCAIPVVVASLGELVGYSMVQGSILVSGLWGVFWFQEVEGSRKKLCWFMSALVSLLGIVLLSAAQA